MAMETFNMANEIQTYTERSDNSKTLARTTALETIKAEYPQFLLSEASAEREIIAFVNQAARIGNLLAEAAGHEHIEFKFWKEHCQELPFNIEAGKKFISIAKKLPKPAATFAEASAAMQQTFFASGLLEEPERTEQQNANPNSPLVVLTNKLTDIKERVQKWIEDEPIASWSNSRKASVRAELEWTVELYKELK